MHSSKSQKDKVIHSKFEIINLFRVPKKAGPTKGLVKSINQHITGLNKLLERYNSEEYEHQLKTILEIESQYHSLLNIHFIDESMDIPGYKTQILEKFGENLKKQQGILKGEESSRKTSITGKIKQTVTPLPDESQLQTYWDELWNKDVEVSRKKAILDKFFGKTDKKNSYKVPIRKFILQEMEQENFNHLIALKNSIQLAVLQNTLTKNRFKWLQALLKLIDKQIALTSGSRNITSKSKFPQVLMEMDADVANQLANILLRGASKYHPELTLRNLYKFKKNKDVNYKKAKDSFKEVLETHEIKFLGGNNSKNFVVINKATKARFVLKVDYRLNNPRDVEKKLMTTALKDTLTPIYAERIITCKNEQCGLFIFDETQQLIFSKIEDFLEETDGYVLRKGKIYYVNYRLQTITEVGEFISETLTNLFTNLPNQNKLPFPTSKLPRELASLETLETITKITGHERVETDLRVLIFTDYYADCNLQEYAERNLSIDTRLKSAVNFYRQMAEIVLIMEDNDVAFPDMKNTNWLSDKGKLYLADTKSFLPTVNGFYDATNVVSKWYGLLSTSYMRPPEFKTSQGRQRFDVKKIHAYQLGKNLYQFLTGCKFQYLNNKDFFYDFDFNYPIFNTNEGLVLKKIITDLLPHNNQASVKSVLDRIVDLDNQLNPKQESKEEIVIAEKMKKPSKREQVVYDVKALAHVVKKENRKKKKVEPLNIQEIILDPQTKDLPLPNALPPDNPKEDKPNFPNIDPPPKKGKYRFKLTKRIFSEILIILALGITFGGLSVLLSPLIGATAAILLGISFGISIGLLVIGVNEMSKKSSGLISSVLGGIGWIGVCACIGASLGMIFPGIGTIIGLGMGAGIGAVIGTVFGMIAGVIGLGVLVGTKEQSIANIPKYIPAKECIKPSLPIKPKPQQPLKLEPDPVEVYAESPLNYK